ncbi:barstar family protein [Flavobacterium sp. '19STA2R22 D10 B1']|uniref:barstar family protein n=1 Tax=Flavobacterium aerium TaxID=3037261 RepID=UPI00278BB884|nr:barstar family protein [Flavobacterium sp. '19STA2R22 D10 B1']
MKKLKIDFRKINTEDQFHDTLSALFGFPDFYGRNGDALIDCLSSLRFPDEGMTTIHITEFEYLCLELYNLTGSPKEIQKEFMAIIEFVNAREKSKDREPSILLHLVHQSH